MNRPLRTSLILVLAVLAGCSEDGASPPAGGGTVGTGTGALTTPGSCELATVWLYDVSGSMARETPAGSGISLLERLKAASTAVIPLIPDDQWNIGVTTFPNDVGLPVWGMDVLDATNRPGLTTAINGLVPAGGTDMEAGLTFAGLMVSTDMQRPKVIVAFSDGEVCNFSGCTPLFNYADFLKNQVGVNIVTVGYQLVSPEDTQMASVASTNADGSPMFLNAGTATELYDFFTDTLGALCESLDVTLEVTPQTVLGSGGNKTIDYSIARLRGPDQSIRVTATGPFLAAGGSITTVPPAAPARLLSAASPTINGKLRVEAAAFMSGSYDANVMVMVDGSTIVLASKTISIEVIPHELHVSFSSPLTWNATNQEILGVVRVDVPNADNTQLSWHVDVTDPATGGPAAGLASPAPGATFVSAADPVFYHAVHIGRSGPTPQRVDVEISYTLGGLGISDSIRATGIAIPP